MGRRYPHPQPTIGVWGSVVSSPSEVRGGAPAKRILVHFELEKNESGDDKFDIFVIFIAHIWSQIYKANSISFLIRWGPRPLSPPPPPLWLCLWLLQLMPALPSLAPSCNYFIDPSGSIVCFVLVSTRSQPNRLRVIPVSSRRPIVCWCEICYLQTALPEDFRAEISAINYSSPVTKINGW